MKCPKCEGTASCLAGESAHLYNWYCDNETCGWNAWTTPQQKIITTEMQITEAVDEIAKLKEDTASLCRTHGTTLVKHSDEIAKLKELMLEMAQISAGLIVAMPCDTYERKKELMDKAHAKIKEIREAANDQNQRTDVGSLQRWLNDEAAK